MTKMSCCRYTCLARSFSFCNNLKMWMCLTPTTNGGKAHHRTITNIMNHHVLLEFMVMVTGKAIAHSLHRWPLNCDVRCHFFLRATGLLPEITHTLSINISARLIIWTANRMAWSAATGWLIKTKTIESCRRDERSLRMSKGRLLYTVSQKKFPPLNSL